MACAVFVSVCIFKILPYVFTESYEVDFRFDSKCRYFNVVFYTLFVHKQLCDYYLSLLILGETYLSKGIQKFSIIQESIHAP